MKFLPNVILKIQNQDSGAHTSHNAVPSGQQILPGIATPFKSGCVHVYQSCFTVIGQLV